jgi:hypothetical protein
MFLRGAIRLGAKARRRAVIGAWMAAILSLPLILMAFPSFPPAGESGAGGSTCGTNSCHHHASTPTGAGGFTTNIPTTYTPGGPAISVTITSAGSPGFELTAIVGGAQAGSFTAGSNTSTQADTAGGATTDIFDSQSGGPWTFMWTPPPAGTTGNVVMNLAGATGATVYANTITLTPAVTTGPPPTPTLQVTPTSLSFTAQAGMAATPSSGSISIKASDNLAYAFTATPSSTGNWLLVNGTPNPASGTTTLSESISVNTAGLAASTTPYTGTVTVAAPMLQGSPITVNVSLTVSSTPPTTGDTFSLDVVDRMSGGTDWLFLDGGHGDTTVTPAGSGSFWRFRGQTTTTRGGGGGAAPTTNNVVSVVSHGTWVATSVCSHSSSKIVLEVQLTPTSGTPSTGRLTVTTSGASLTINGTGGAASCTGATTGGVTFNASSVGIASIDGVSTTGGGTAGGGGGGGGDDSGTTGGTGTGGTGTGGTGTGGTGTTPDN